MSHVGHGLRDDWGKIMIEVARRHDKVILVDADVAPATRANGFAREFPDRFVQFGCAEQNMVSAAAGMATMGLIPILSIFACFCSRRVADQVSISIAYPRLNVKLVGSYAGLTTPNTGATHQAVDDVNILRGIPNLIVFEAADAVELAQIMEACVRYEGPTYVRVVRCDVPHVVPDHYEFRIGRAAVLREGSDITLIAAGLMVSRALEAADKLARKGISAEVVNMSTIKPVDAAAIVTSAAKTRHVLTVENHSVIGGLGSAVAEVLSERYPTRLRRVGIQDQFGTSGSLDTILKRYGLTAENICNQAESFLAGKESS
jgi:transketolase